MISEMAENTHKVVAMIISFVTPHANLDLVVTGIACSLEEHLRMELVEVGIRSSLEAPSVYRCALPQKLHLQCECRKNAHIIDEDIDRSLHPSHKDTGIITRLSFFYSTREVPPECLLTPWDSGWLTNRGESGARAVLLCTRNQGVEIDGKRTMTTHGVTKDGLARKVLTTTRVSL